MSNRPLSRLVLPRWVSILVGVVCVGLGLYLLTRPLTSLTTLAVLIGLACLAGGVADLIAATKSATPRAGVAAAIGWIVLGVVILVWLGYTIDLLAPVAAVALAVSGVIGLVRAVRGGTVDERVATVLFGLADLVFAVVAWRWPDLTLLVLAFLFGIRLIFLGVARIWAGLRRTGATERPGAIAPSVRVVGAALALVIALAAAGIAARLDAGRPSIDAFYTPPADMPAEPGQLLRAEPFTRDIPDTATAWRILYTTSRDEGQAAVGSGIVMVSDDAPPGPRPVIAWAHGTTGFAQPCAPSLLAEPFVAGALPAEAQLLDRGWALVATDYVGLGTAGPHPYLIGQGEGRSVLDAVRAAHQLEQLDLAEQTVVWGHSQGGHAALWTGILAPTYAPDVEIIGVAAMAPASDPIGLTSTLGNVTGGSVFGSYVVAAYTGIYPDVDFDTYIRPSARTLVREMAQRCLSEPGVFVSVLSALSIESDIPIYRMDPITGAFGRRLSENTPTGAMAFPVLLAQGATDSLITANVQADYAGDRCAERWNLDYRAYPDRDHLGIIADDSPLIPDLLDWTDARFAGALQLPRCP